MPDDSRRALRMKHPPILTPRRLGPSPTLGEHSPTHVSSLGKVLHPANDLSAIAQMTLRPRCPWASSSSPYSPSSSSPAHSTLGSASCDLAALRRLPLWSATCLAGFGSGRFRGFRSCASSLLCFELCQGNGAARVDVELFSRWICVRRNTEVATYGNKLGVFVAEKVLDSSHQPLPGLHFHVDNVRFLTKYCCQRVGICAAFMMIVSPLSMYL